MAPIEDLDAPARPAPARAPRPLRWLLGALLVIGLLVALSWPLPWVWTLRLTLERGDLSSRRWAIFRASALPEAPRRELLVEAFLRETDDELAADCVFGLPELGLNTLRARALAQIEGIPPGRATEMLQVASEQFAEASGLVRPSFDNQGLIIDPSHILRVPDVAEWDWEWASVPYFPRSGREPGGEMVISSVHTVPEDVDALRRDARALLGQLSSVGPSWREPILKTLSFLGPEGAPLGQELLELEGALGRRDILDLLLRWRPDDELAVAWLAELARGEDPELRKDAVIALGQVRRGDAAALRACEAALADPAGEVAEQALISAAMLGSLDRRVLPAIRARVPQSLARTDRSANSRRLAYAYGSCLGQEEDLERIREIIETALASRERCVLGGAARSDSETNCAAWVEPLFRGLAVRGPAVASLVPWLRGLLPRLLRSEAPALMVLIGRIGPAARSLAPALKERFGDPDLEGTLGPSLAWALTRIGAAD